MIASLSTAGLRAERHPGDNPEDAPRQGDEPVVDRSTSLGDRQFRRRVLQAQSWLFAERRRPIRFAITGALSGVTQLGLLTLITHHGLQALAANALAFVLAAQLNFALSSLFTWRDRRDTRSIGQRWLTFHASILGMACVNMAVFAAARLVAPDLVASAMGIVAASIGNFLLGDRLIFRHRQRNTEPLATEPQESAA